MKEARLKSLHALWFYSHPILEKWKLYKRETDQWLPEAGEDRGWLQRGVKKWEGMKLFYILSVVIMRFYAHAKIHQKLYTKKDDFTVYKNYT